MARPWQSGGVAIRNARAKFVVTRDYKVIMRTIGIRELKAQLSRVLREVQDGDHYLITDHGRVVAELRQPLSTDDANLSRTDQVRLQMARAGELRLAERPRWSYGVERPIVQLPDGTAQGLLDWARGDG